MKVWHPEASTKSSSWEISARTPRPGSQLAAPPAGLAELAPTRALFRTMWEVDGHWLPGIRELCRQAEAEGKKVARLHSLEAIEAFAQAQAGVSAR